MADTEYAPDADEKAMRRREQKRLAARRYYHRNREKELERQRARSPEVKAAYAARSAAYRDAHREKLRVAARARYWEKREELLGQMRDRREEKKDEYNANRRKKRASNPESARANQREYYAQNPDARAARAVANKKWYARNRDGQLEKMKEWREENKEAHLANAKRWREANLERAKANLKAWRLANPDYAVRRYNADPEAMLERRLRARLTIALERVKANKASRFIDLLGCDLKTLRAHIEGQFLPGMTWENHGDWHVDHIRPVCTFDLSDTQQQFDCFCFVNLRPLWAKDNLSRPRRNWRPGDTQPEGLAA